MKIPDDLPHEVLQTDDHVEVRKYPLLWTIVVLSPVCALFWVGVIWGLTALFSR